MEVIPIMEKSKALLRAEAFILDLYDKGEPVTNSYVRKTLNKKSYINSIKKYYGSYAKGIESICGIVSYEEYSNSRLTKTKWTRDTLKDWLIASYNSGEDVRVCALQTKYIFECIIREYGTYEALWVACGLDYNQYKKDTAVDTGKLSVALGVLGCEFEALMDEILIEFGYNYTKYKIAEDTKLSPDNIYDNGTIGDSKLSYNYKVAREVVSKYKEYSKHIEIYTLNSSKNFFTINILDIDVKVYNVDYFITMLPEYLQEHYQIKVNNLRAEYNKIYEDFREAV